MSVLNVVSLVVVLALVVVAGVLTALNPFALRIGWRYLWAKKRITVSVITFIAVEGVALGVWALLVVMSITSGFQAEFRDKVLGVNAHVLVQKYGLDFEDYRDVIERAREMPEVTGAAPFLIQDMMMATDDRTHLVLVKGVDPELMPTVLDLPEQLTQGSLEGMRAEGAAPPLRPEDLLTPVGEDWSWLAELADSRESDEPNGQASELQPDGDDDVEFVETDELPEVDVPTPDEAEAALGEVEEPELPPDDYLDQYFEEEEDLLSGDDEGRSTDELPGVVIGAELARTLAVGVGDRVRIVSPLAGLDTSMFRESDSNVPRARDFRVIAIFEAGFQEYDNHLVYADLYEVQHFFDHGDSVTGVELRLGDITQAPAVARRLERVLGGAPYHTTDWQELNRNLFTALRIQRFGLSIIIGLIICVAALNVIGTLIMIVIEKKREIAILKAMGSPWESVMLIFMVQGLVIGLLGTAQGLLLGWGTCWYLDTFRFPLDPAVYLIDHLPVQTSGTEFLLTTATALSICLLATVVPSAWAARLLPAEGVRHE